MITQKWHRYCLSLTLLLFTSATFAASTSIALKPKPNPTPASPQLAMPAPPELGAKAYSLMDYNSGQIIAKKMEISILLLQVSPN